MHDIRLDDSLIEGIETGAQSPVSQSMDCLDYNQTSCTHPTEIDIVHFKPKPKKVIFGIDEQKLRQ